MSITVASKPSLQGKFALIWSGDPSLQPRPEDPALAEQYDHSLTTCRERGEWGPLLKDGDKPTVFSFEFPKGTIRRRLSDHVRELANAGRNGELAAMFFRATVREVTGLGAYKLKLVRDEETGLDLVADDLVDLLDAADPLIVLELAGVALQRFLGISGK
jgi:hypothetical protein